MKKISTNFSFRCYNTKALKTALVFIISSFLALTSVNSQVSTQYVFSASAGTFTPLSGGTAIPGMLADTYVSGAVPIGFNFTYLGTPYTNVYATSNGTLSFNATSATLTTNNLATTTAASRPLLAPLWDDLDGRATGGSTASYLTTGTTGSQVFTFEWLNWEWNYASTNPVVSFQVKLYEATGAIEFVYRSESGAVNSGSASIGITDVGTGAGNFISLSSTSTSPLISSTTETTSLSTKPTTGQIYKFTPATCLGVSGLTTASITTTSADISWTASTSSPASGYNWELRTSGNAGSGVTGLIQSGSTVTAVTNVSLTSLLPSTVYNYYVRAKCSATDSSGWSSGTFTTACNPITTFPWTEGFEGLTTVGANVLPPCWTTELITGTNFTSANTAVRNSLGARTGTNYVWSRWSSNAWLYSPAVQLTMGQSYDYSFYYRQTDASTGFTLTTAWGTNPASADMTNVLGTITNPVNTTYEQAKYSFIAPATGVYYFGVHSDAPTTAPWYLEYDDFKLELSPTCTEPNSLVTSNITSSSAQIDWTPPATSTPISYSVYYSTTNTAPTLTTAPTIAGITSTTVNLTGLSSATTYYLWVRSKCSASDSSGWSIVKSFTTNCPLATLPVNTGFEGATSLPICWSSQLVSGTRNFLVGNTTTAAGTSPNPVAYGGTNRLLFPSYNGSGDKTRLVSPAIVTTGSSSVDVNFQWYFSITGGATSYLTEGVQVQWSTDGTTWTDEGTLIRRYGATDGWAPQSVSITSAGNLPTVYIGLLFTSNAGYDSYVDSIDIHATPTCTPPTALVSSNVTAATAQIDWTAPATSTPSSYSLYYSTTNTAPATTASPNVSGISATTYTLSGLAAATKYYVWVRSKCSATDSSAWSIAGNFTTLCTAVSSFTQNFDAVTTPALPICWAKVGTMGLANTQNTNSSSPSNCLYMYPNTSVTDVPTVSLPPLSNINAGTHRLRFKLRGNSTAGANVEVGYLTNPTDATSFVLLQSVTASTLAYQSFEVMPGTTPGSNDVLAIRHGGNLWYSVLIDDIVWEPIPTCETVTAIIPSAITTSSVQLDWTAPATGGTPVSYSLYYSTTNTPPALTAAPSVAGITGITYTLGGLNSSTAYFVWVRSKCSVTDSSAWSASATFTTACNPVTVLPWNEGFEGLTTVGANILPPCWSTELITGTNFTSANTPVRNSLGARNGTNYVWSRWSSNTWLYSPAIQLTVGQSYDYSFYYRQTDASSGFTVTTAWGTNPASVDMTNVLGTITNPINTTYSQAKYTFVAPATGVYYFGVHSEAPTTAPWYLEFDDFKLEFSPTCVEPTTLISSSATTTSVQVDWTAPLTGTPISYSLYYSTTNAAPALTAAPSVAGITGTTYVLSSLAPSTAYYVWVRSKCSATDSSSWTSAFQIATLPENDDCTNPVSLVKGVGVTGTSIGATETLPASLCSAATSTTAFDVWYKFTAAYDGAATITLTGVSSAADLVLEAYSGACGSFTSLGCVDVGGAGGNETLNLTSLLAGQDYYARVYGYTTATNTNQGTFTITVTGTALPVSFASFTGEKKGYVNVLNWRTISELNNTGFELTRSADGVNFSKIAFVNTKAENGNSNTILNYSFIDEKPFATSTYYRLKQVDKDGRSTISNIVVIKGDKISKLELVNLYPNPAKALLTVSITSPKTDKITFIISDITGKVVGKQTMQVVSGDNTLRINVQSLTQGSYMIKALCADGCETSVKKFIKE